MQEVLLLQMLTNKANGIILSENNVLKNSNNMGEVFDFAKLFFTLTNGAKLDKTSPQKIMPQQKQNAELNQSLTNKTLPLKPNKVAETNNADKINVLQNFNQSQKKNVDSNENLKTKDANESSKIVQSLDEQDVVPNSTNLQQQQNVKDNDVQQESDDVEMQKVANAKTSASVVEKNSSAKEVVPLKEAVQNVSGENVEEELSADEKTMLAILNQLIAVMETIRKLLSVNVNEIVQNTAEENINLVQIVQQLNTITDNLETLRNSASNLKQEVKQLVNNLKEKVLQLKPELAPLLQTKDNEIITEVKNNVANQSPNNTPQNVTLEKIISLTNLPEKQNANVLENSSTIKTEILKQPKEIPLVKNHSPNENNLLKEIALLLKDLQGVVEEIKTSQVQVNNNQVEEQKPTANNIEILSQLQQVEDKVKNLLNENSVIGENNVAVETTEVKISSLKINNELQVKPNNLNEENKAVVLNSSKTDLSNKPLLEQETNDNILQKIVSSVRNFSHEMKSGSGYDVLLREQLVLNFAPQDKQAISLFLQNMQNLMSAGEIKSVALNNALQNDTQNNNGFDAQTSSGNNLLLGLKEAVNLKTADTNFENIISTKAISPENIIENIVQGARLILSKDYGEMKIKLKPENLGEVTLKIMLEEGLVRANIQAQNQQVVSVLEKNISTLEEQLKHQGIKLDEIIVQQYANNGSDFNSQQQLAEKNQQHLAQTKSFYFGNADRGEKENASAMSLNTASSYLDKLSNINFLA